MSRRSPGACPGADRSAAPSPSGSTRGKLPGSPPPVMWLDRAHVDARAQRRALTRARRGASARAAPRPRVVPRSSGGASRRSRASSRSSSTCARASSRSSAGRSTASADRDVARLRRACRRRSSSASTTPTANPARSYSPSAYMPGSSAVSPPSSAQPRLLAAVGDAADHRLGDADVELAGAEVVEEEERPRAAR